MTLDMKNVRQLVCHYLRPLEGWGLGTIHIRKDGNNGYKIFDDDYILSIILYHNPERKIKIDIPCAYLYDTYVINLAYVNGFRELKDIFWLKAYETGRLLNAKRGMATKE